MVSAGKKFGQFTDSWFTVQPKSIIFNILITILHALTSFSLTEGFLNKAWPFRHQVFLLNIVISSLNFKKNENKRSFILEKDN